MNSRKQSLKRMAPKGRLNTPLKRTGIPGAEKKLRQAELFLGHLEEARSRDPERLEAYFSASLTATRSAYEVLRKNFGSKLNEAEASWREVLIDGDEDRFDWMMNLRDDDVHFGTTGAEPLAKYIEEGWHTQSVYQFRHRNAALFGQEAVLKEENPDGKKVRGPVLRGTVGLYLDHGSARLEATTVCRVFIDNVRSLLDAVKEIDAVKEMR